MFDKLCGTTPVLQHFPVTLLSQQYTLSSPVRQQRLPLSCNLHLLHCFPPFSQVQSIQSACQATHLHPPCTLVHTISIFYFPRSLPLHSLPYFFILQSINFTPKPFFFSTETKFSNGSLPSLAPRSQTPIPVCSPLLARFHRLSR